MIPAIKARRTDPSIFTLSAPVIVVLGYLLALAWAMSHWSRNIWGGMALFPVLLVVTLSVVTRCARQDGDPRMVPILQAAVLVKLGVGTLLRYAVVYGLYGGVADAQGYDGAGRLISSSLLNGNLSVDLGNGGDGTRAMNALTGLLYSVTGPTNLGAFFVFSWLAFIGLFLFYRAYRIACPTGDHRRYALLLFFLPSMVFWPSSLGKESWLLFTLGLATYGTARILDRQRNSFVILGIGLWGTALVRPHIAVLVFGAAAVAYLLRGHGPKHVNAGLGKLVGVVALVCIGMVMAGSLKDQFNLDQLDGAAVEQIFDKTITQTSTGNSGYDAVNAIKNPLRFPLAVVAVLFRPFPFEAGNGPPMATAIEGVFLMVLFALSWRRVFGAIRLLRKAPFVAFAATYSLLFVIAFSSIGNFGILARQRCQLLPFLIVLLAAPTPMRTRAGAGASRAIRAGKRMKSGRPSTTDGPAWTSGGKPVSNTVRRDAQ